MARKNKAEEIIGKLHEATIVLSQGAMHAGGLASPNRAFIASASNTAV